MSTVFKDDIEHWFTHHPPTPEQIAKYTALREAGKELALLIHELCPPGKVSVDAITAVRLAIMHANMSIACHREAAASSD